MALTIQEDKGATGAIVVADRRIWLDANGQAVEDGDPTARFLFCAAGQRVSKAKAEAAGVTFTKPATAKKSTKKKTKSTPAGGRKTKKG